MRVFTQLGRLGLVGLGRGRKIRKNQILLTTTQKQNAMTPARRNRNNWLPSIFNDFLAPEWVEVAAPGMTRDDFKVHINEDNELIISLEKSSAPKEEEKHKGTYLRREFSYTQFQQSLLLPDNVVRDKIEAKVENGVMTIDIPKKKESETMPTARQIEVR